jgi:2-hydroxychromene-2-carboxylate isomerase
MPASPAIDFWLSMGSTYTYLTVMRLSAVEASAGSGFRWRPFNLRSIFDSNNYFPLCGAIWSAGRHRIRVRLRVPTPHPSKNSAFTTRIALVGSHEGWVKEFALAAYRRWLQLGEGVRAGGVVKDAALPG